MFAGQKFPDFPGRKVFFDDLVEILVHIHHLIPCHAFLDIEIENDCHISFRVMDDPVDFELGRVVVNGGIFFQAEYGLADRMNRALACF